MVDLDFVMGEYTQELYDAIWDIAGRDFEQDYDSVELLEKLNSPDFFRPFSERLLAFYNEALSSNFTVDEAKTDLLLRAKQSGIDLNRGTMGGWFSGKAPKYDETARKNLFAIAFTLELDAERTEKLFHKVFLDKAFNKRNVREFIYLYCINKRKPLSAAESLISKAESIGAADIPEEQTERTQFLEEALGKDIDEGALLDFIYKHQKNFSLNNTAAKAHRQKLLDRLTGSASHLGLAQREYERRRPGISDDKYGKSMISVDFLFYMIMGIDFAQKKNNDALPIRERFLRKEIHNNFPDKLTLSMFDPSSYILRKDIILLQFYDYWVTDYLSGQSIGDYDGFVEGLNDILYGCGFSPLYIGNPFDWLFLYCSACADDSYTPLDRFRGILMQD